MIQQGSQLIRYYDTERSVIEMTDYVTYYVLPETVLC